MSYIFYDSKPGTRGKDFDPATLPKTITRPEQICDVGLVRLCVGILVRAIIDKDAAQRYGKDQTEVDAFLTSPLCSQMCAVCSVPNIGRIADYKRAADKIRYYRTGLSRSKGE